MIRYFRRSIVRTMLSYCQLDQYASLGKSTVLSVLNNSDNASSTIILDNSILYPEGGGQPSDRGTVNGIEILDVQKHQGTQVSVKLGATFDQNVTEVDCMVNWTRRYDFMQQHTAQHLFSAIAYKLYGAETVGWALGDETVTVDLLSADYYTTEQISAMEMATNDEIRKGTQVNCSLHNREDLDSLPHLRGVPKGAAADLQQLRLVGIENLDLNPCGGTHLKTVSEIQVFKVIGLEKDRGSTRVRFVAGQRALHYFSRCVDREAELSSLLSAPVSQHVGIVDKLFKDKRDISKQLKSSTDELIVLLSNIWLSQLPPAPAGSPSSSSSETVEPAVVLAVHRAGPGADLSFLLALAELLSTARPDVLLYLSGQDSSSSSAAAAAAVTDNSSKAKSGKSKSTSSSLSSLSLNKLDCRATPSPLPGGPVAGAFVLFGPRQWVDAARVRVLEAVAGKGGGRPGKLQGAATQLQNIDKVHVILTSVVSA